MCMEDIRLGRQLSGMARPVACGAGVATVVALADERRTRLILSGDGTDIVWTGPASSPPAANRGFSLTVSRPLYVFTVEEWGPMVTEAWSCFPNAAGQTIMVGEASLGKQ